MEIIYTPRLIIYPYTADEQYLDDLHRLLSDPITMQFWPAPLNRQAAVQWHGRQLESYHLHGFGRAALLLRENKHYIGDAGIIKAEIDGQAENDLGYIISHYYQGQGFASEAVKALIEQALGAWQLPRVVANMAFDHLASERVAQKAGMKKEKTFYNPKNRGLLTFLYSL